MAHNKEQWKQTKNSARIIVKELNSMTVLNKPRPKLILVIGKLKESKGNETCSLIQSSQIMRNTVIFIVKIFYYYVEKWSVYKIFIFICIMNMYVYK